MSLATRPVVGTIRIETLPDAADPLPLGVSDYTLECLLAAFAQHESLGCPPAVHDGHLLVASGRLRSPARPTAEPEPVVRANLGRLLSELHDEFERIVS